MSFVPHSEDDQREMLRAIGASSVTELYADIPERLMLDEPPDLPAALSEWEAVRLLHGIAAENLRLTSFAGAGIYDHHVPAAVDHLIRRSEFYTAYTPYQPEVSQGTLQAIYEFQTMVCRLTGMEVANASMYDGASAAGEAAVMALSVTGRRRVLLAGTLHPHYRRVVETYLSGLEASVETVEGGGQGVLDPDAVGDRLDGETACVLVQSPNFFGAVEELEALAEAAHAAGALLVAAVADPLSLALLRPPGDLGADVVVAEGQLFGNAPSFGGPVVGLFATRSRYIRRMPGRIVGATLDAEGRSGYVLTLQTREQQIRREKATSNICTNQGLNALAATIYLALVGKRGLWEIAEAAVRSAHYARERLQDVEGVELLHPEAHVVREFAVRTREDSRTILRRGLEVGLLAGVSLSRFPGLGTPDGLLLAFTEKHTRPEIDALVRVVAGSGGPALGPSSGSAADPGGVRRDA
ncbi:MAG: aminomethyl-transferring glycine dehydrogenase subunit GcvPA [Gemmatimonadota bacterium]